MLHVYFLGPSLTLRLCLYKQSVCRCVDVYNGEGVAMVCIGTYMYMYVPGVC